MNLNALRRNSLKTRVTFFTLAIFLLGIWSLAFYAGRMLREDMQRLLSEQQRSITSYIAADVNRALNERLRGLELIAGLVGPAKLGGTADLQAFLDTRPVLNSLFNAGIFITRTDGTAIAEFPPSTGWAGINYMERDFIAGALREGKTMIGKPVVGKVSRNPLVAMAAPIRNAQGRVIGAIAGVTDLSKPNFLDQIAEHHYGKTGGFLLIAPQHRQIVTATDKSRTMETLPAPGVNPLIDRFMLGYEGTQVLTNPLGVEVLASVKGIPAANWLAATALPTVEAFAPIHAMQQRLLFATILLTILAGGLSWWLLRRQLAPMLTAIQTLAALTVNDQPPQPLAVARNDEIGLLIGGFNQLLETLRIRELALRESHETLLNLQETTLDGYWSVDAQGNLLDVNPAYCRQSGYTRAELLAMRITDLEDQESANDISKHIEYVTARGHDQFITRHRRKDGSIWHVEISTTYRDVAGGRFCVFLRDITERKHTEQELEQYRHHLEERVAARTAELAAAKTALEAVNRRLYLNDRRLSAMLALSRMANELDINQLLQRGANEAVRLCDSEIGYLHFVNDDQETLTLAFWTNEPTAARKPEPD